MATLRRLYMYGAALAALEVWLWSLTALLTKALRGTVWMQAETLAGALAGFLIGLPIFWLHWRWAQRAAAEDEDERHSPVRTAALYIALALTWGIVFHGGAALLARGLERCLPMPAWVDLFPAIGWARALAMSAVHGLAGWYFARVLAVEEPAFTATQAVIRRWYRFLWMTYGLGWLGFGLQQVLTVFAPPPGMFAAASLSRFAAQGVVLLAGGGLLWGWWGRRWWQHILTDPAEHRSPITIGFLMAWALTGLVVGLVALGTGTNRLLQVLLGENVPLRPALRLVVTVGVPWVAVWIGAQWGMAVVLRRWESASRAAAYRLFLSIVAYGALTTAVSTGVAGLLTYLSHALFSNLTSHTSLTSGITLLLIGVPLWSLAWRALQREASADEHARHTVLRRAYLYLILFTALLSLMGFATAVVFQLLRALLGGQFSAQAFTFATGIALWVAAVLAYHARVLWSDRQAASARAENRPVPLTSVLVIAAPHAPWLDALPSAPDFALTVRAPHEPPPEDAAAFKIVVLSDAQLAHLSPAWQAWLADFSGYRVVVPSTDSRWLWMGRESAPRDLLSTLQALAAGKQPRGCRPHPIWMGLAYIGILALVMWGLGIVVPLFFGLLLNLH